MAVATVMSPVPDVTGRQVAEAQQQLTDALYLPLSVDIFGTTTPRGVVIDQAPSAGTSWMTGRSVAIGVAAGRTTGGCPGTRSHGRAARSGHGDAGNGRWRDGFLVNITTPDVNVLVDQLPHRRSGSSPRDDGPHAPQGPLGASGSEPPESRSSPTSPGPRRCRTRAHGGLGRHTAVHQGGRGQIDPLLVGILRTVLAGCLALPLALAMRQPLPADTRGKQLLAFSGFAAFIAFPLMFTVGQSTTSAMHGALVLATLPVFTSLFGTLIERRRVSRRGSRDASSRCRVRPSSSSGVPPGPRRARVCVAILIVLASSAICALGYVAGARLTQSGYASVPTTLWGAAGAAPRAAATDGVAAPQDRSAPAGAAAWGSTWCSRC